MNVNFQKSYLNDFETPLVLIGVLDEAKEDPHFSGLIDAAKSVIEHGDFRGKHGDLSIVYTQGAIRAERILLVGLGKKDKLTAESIRQVVGNASRKARDLDVKKISVFLDSFSRGIVEVTEATEALVQGIIMGSFQNIVYRTMVKKRYSTG